MKNELLRIGPFTVYGYGLMIAIGILAAYFTGEYRAKKRKLPYEHVFYLVVWCVVGGFLGAKILYWITEWKSILENPGFLSATLTDGFVVFGGIVGGILYLGNIAATVCNCIKTHHANELIILIPILIMCCTLEPYYRIECAVYIPLVSSASVYYLRSR